VLIAREAVRLLVVEHRIHGFGALWRGWLAARAMAASQRPAPRRLGALPDGSTERFR
jgi:hypothetical protein